MEFAGVGASPPPSFLNPAPAPSSVQAQQAQPNAQPPSAPANSGPAPGTPDDSDRGQTVDVQA